jgi:putative ABC transport system permease protein
MMLASGLTDSFGELVAAQGYGLRITPAGTLPFDTEAAIPDAAAVRRRVEQVPGVGRVAPILGTQLYRVVGDSVAETLFTTGVDPRTPMLYTLASGREPEAGQVVVSRPLAEAARLRVGSQLQLAAELDAALGRPRQRKHYTVSGIADFIYDYAGQRSIALPLEDVQALAGATDEVSLFGVAAADGVDQEDLAARIGAAVPDVSVYSTGDLMAAMDERLLYFKQLATILGSIALVVTALLVGTIVTIGVRERFGEIATLRAIGVRRGRLLLGIVAEGFTLTLLGCVVGLPLGLWMAGRLDDILRTLPGLPARVSFFVLQPAPVLLAFATVVAAGALVGLLPGLDALATPLGQALREEAE